MPNFKDTYIPIDAQDYVTCTTYVIAHVNLDETDQPVLYKNSAGQSLYVQVSQDALQKEVLTISQSARTSRLKTSQLVKADKARAYRIIGEFLDIVSKSPKDAAGAAKKKSRKK